MAANLNTPLGSVSGFGNSRRSRSAKHFAGCAISGCLAAKLRKISRDEREKYVYPHATQTFKANPNARKIKYIMSAANGRWNLWASYDAIPSSRLVRVTGRVYAATLLEKRHVRDHHVRAYDTYCCRHSCDDALLDVSVLRAMGYII